MYTRVTHAHTQDLVPVMCFFLTEQMEGNNGPSDMRTGPGSVPPKFGRCPGGFPEAHAHLCACQGPQEGAGVGTRPPHVAVDPAGRPAPTIPEQPNVGF